MEAARYLPALPTRGRPDLLQRLQRVVGILRFALPATPFGDLLTRSRWLGCARQPAPGIVTRPAGDLHHLIQDFRLVRLRRLHIRLGELRGDFGTRRHRQPTSHAWRASPFRGHSYVMHQGRFAGTFRDACRMVDKNSPSDTLCIRAMSSSSTFEERKPTCWMLTLTLESSRRALSRRVPSIWRRTRSATPT
jgi:hypothetical protein